MGDIINLSNVCKVYQMGKIEVRALHRVSFSIAVGEYVSIMGHSGSGKSTLLNILGCLDRPTAGEYHLAGHSVGQLSTRDLAGIRNKEIGFVFQSFNLLSRLDAMQNVELPLIYAGVETGERRRRAEEALALVNLSDRKKHRPQELSGGQQQRVAIARALANRPGLILADEPTGNLDTRTSIELMGLFQELNESGITVVMVTHELDIAGYCRRILVMRDGRIISDSRNEKRRVAVKEIAALNLAEQKAKLA